MIGRYHKGRVLRYIFLKRHGKDEDCGNLSNFSSQHFYDIQVLKRMSLQPLTQRQLQIKQLLFSKPLWTNI
jgi:hypothetical protein